MSNKHCGQNLSFWFATLHTQSHFPGTTLEISLSVGLVPSLHRRTFQSSYWTPFVSSYFYLGFHKVRENQRVSSSLLPKFQAPRLMWPRESCKKTCVAFLLNISVYTTTLLIFLWDRFLPTLFQNNSDEFLLLPYYVLNIIVNISYVLLCLILPQTLKSRQDCFSAKQMTEANCVGSKPI